MLFPPFLGTWKEHVHHGHTHIHCTIQTILLLCVWFQTESLSYWFSLFSSFFFRLGRCTRLVCACRREREKGHWNVFVEQQIYFLIPNFVCLPFRYFLTYPTKMLKNRHGNRLADSCLCQTFPVDNWRKSYTPFPNLRLCNLGTFFLIISFGQMSRGYPIALSHCCLFLSFDFFSGWECWCNATQDWNDKERIISTYILWLCVASRRSNSVDSARLFHQRFHQLFGDF